MPEHETQFVALHPNGQTEFICPTCGYHIIIGDNSVMWLDYGDPEASHHGGNSDRVRIRGVSVEESEELPGLEDFKAQGWEGRL